MTNRRAILAWLFLGIGLGFTLIGMAKGGWAIVLGNASLETEGTIIEVAENSPVVRYQAFGRDYEHRSNVLFNARSIGDKVPVLYFPGDPSQIQIDTFVHRWLSPTAYAAVGLFAIGVGSSILLARRSARRAAARNSN
jgi:hypothetical protein